MKQFVFDLFWIEDEESHSGAIFKTDWRWHETVAICPAPSSEYQIQEIFSILKDVS